MGSSRSILDRTRLLQAISVLHDDLSTRREVNNSVIQVRSLILPVNQSVTRKIIFVTARHRRW